MRAEEPIHDDPVIGKVAAVRPPVPEDDLSPDGWRARAIEARVLAGSAPVPAPRPRTRWARPARRIVTAGPAPREPHRMRRGRWMGALRPGLGIAATVAIVIAIVVIAGSSHARHDITTPAAVHPVPGTPPPAPTSLLPAHGGMRGLLSAPSFSGSGSDLTAIFEQCPQCRTRLRGTARLWQSRSVDGGRTWHTERVAAPKRADLGLESQAGDAVWTVGDIGETIPAIFVSHDDGQHYAAAVTAAAPASQSSLTISDGTVWALGNRCDGQTCRAVVLSGPVGGDRLTAAASQPALRPHVNDVQAVIGAHGSTVVITGGFAATDLATFVSDDSGRSWTRVTYPCRRPVQADVYPASTGSLWAVCLATRASARTAGHRTDAPGTPLDIIRRSTDGGHHWTTTATLAQLEPTLSAVTGQVAWIIGAKTGTVKRTTDGGRTWQTVLQTPDGAEAELAVQNAQTATTVVAASTGSVTEHRRRTDLVCYRTTDGGAHWTPTVIKLPTG